MRKGASEALQSLLKEAKKNRVAAARRFKKHDNIDDMHEEEAWSMVVGWLTMKAAAPEPSADSGNASKVEP
jgi:hypothetical protein